MTCQQFPALVIDNFFDDPHKVRDFALSLEYRSPLGGNYPGERTGAISDINYNFFSTFCNRLFQPYFHYPEDNAVTWNVEATFQKIFPYDDDRHSPLNSGWIHTDSGGSIAAGVIYLNPVSYPEAGTSFYKLKKDVFHTKGDFDYRNRIYGGEKFEPDFYKKQLDKNNNQYEKTMEVGNVFNRCIFYGSDIPHKENCFVANDDEPRLTLVFFINKINSTIQSNPLPRLREKGIEF